MIAILAALAALAPFTAVDASGDVRVAVVRGTDVGVKAPPQVTAEVKDGVLVLAGPATTAKPILVTVALPTLTALHARGAAHVDALDVDGKILDVTAADSARVKLAGKVASLRVQASGSARVDAQQLTAQQATVELARAARATVHATQSLDVDLSGASRCTAAVKPKRLAQKLQGAARLELP